MPGRTKIDTDRARVLRARNLTWAQVGAQLAAETKRPVAFQAESVRLAVVVEDKLWKEMDDADAKGTTITNEWDDGQT